MNAGMDAEKPNDRTIGESIHTGRIHERHGGEGTEPRVIGKYTYRLVHTQKSVRMLDLRLDIAELEDLTDLRELFDDAARAILSVAIIEGIDIISQVRYKDS